MDLRKILKWLVLLMLVVVAWKEGWPRLQAKLADSGRATSDLAATGGNDADRCVREAANAAQDFGDGVSKYGRDRSDTAGWMHFAGRIQYRVQEARGICDCPGDACARAAEALGRLDSLIQRTDGMVRGSTDAVFNPATDMEEIYNLLDQAQAALRGPP